MFKIEIEETIVSTATVSDETEKEIARCIGRHRDDPEWESMSDKEKILEAVRELHCEEGIEYAEMTESDSYTNDLRWSGFEQASASEILARHPQELEDADIMDIVQSLCGCGTCLCSYDCGHANKADKSMLVPKTGIDTVCPLAKYNVTPDTNGKDGFLKKPASSGDIRKICTSCRHAQEYKDKEGGISYTNTLLEEHCMDCPVFMAAEAQT